jgi:3-carboxy-cis,cis-muconate cycloisomerase
MEHSGRDRLAGLAASLSLISGSLGKIGADVALLSQSEISIVVLEGGGQSSSIPNKSNPVNAELLIALARFNAGLLGIFHQGLVHENERSGSAWTLEWLVLPQMVISTGASLRLSCNLAEQIRFQGAV